MVLYSSLPFLHQLFNVEWLGKWRFFSIQDLDAANKKELEAVLKGFLKKGETLKLSLKVDPTIIGGMIVSIGDKYVDMSIGSKIKKYTKLIEASV